MSGTKLELPALGHEPMPVLRAVRAKCLDCSGGSPAEVTDCRVPTCPLYPFRLGRNPWRAEPSEAQRQARRRNAATLASPVPFTGFGAPDGRAATSLPANEGVAS
jgi:hypothetical protein